VNSVVLPSRRIAAANAWVVLGGSALVLAGLVALCSVAWRAPWQGTDTPIYAAWYLSLRSGVVVTRFEPLFVLASRLSSAAGLGVSAWQGLLFLLLAGGGAVATRAYARDLGSTANKLLPAATMFLLLSPVFVNASINATRQGLAAFPIIAALLAFQGRRWVAFVVWSAVATGFHYSALLYIALAPVLLLPPRWLQGVAALAFAAYAAGLTMIATRILSPSAYAAVMAYGPYAVYRAGVRLDFAVFTLFWYGLPMLVARSVREPWAGRIVDLQGVYLVLVLPFLLVGWGNYSNRFLLPAWLFASLVVAALCVHSRLPLLRHPVVIGLGLLMSAGVFAFYISQGVAL
jgi:hypothetical protein